MSATYAIYTSPSHQPIPNHLPTLIVTPYGKPNKVLYTYLHTNQNQENYLLTPSDQGDLCVAKLFPRKRTNDGSSSSSRKDGIRCEASRNLRWTITNEGIQNPVYKLTLPNPDQPQIEQPLFQVSKPNPHSPWWTLFYFTYAGHLIPPKRVEFGKIIKSPPSTQAPRSSGETKISVTGRSEEERAVWKTLGEGNEDMVEWILICASLNVLDDEITKAAEAAGVRLTSKPSSSAIRPSGVEPPTRSLHPTGNAMRGNLAPIRPAIYHHPTTSHRPPNSNPNSYPHPHPHPQSHPHPTSQPQPHPQSQSHPPSYPQSHPHPQNQERAQTYPIRHQISNPQISNPRTSTESNTTPTRRSNEVLTPRSALAYDTTGSERMRSCSRPTPPPSHHQPHHPVVAHHPAIVPHHTVVLPHPVVVSSGGTSGQNGRSGTNPLRVRKVR